jgi:hypothetical protein
MILKVKKSKSKSSTNDKNKKSSNIVESTVIKKPKLLKNYKTMETCKYDTLEIPVSKLSYGIINSCEIKTFITPEGRIELTNSWLELLIILLDTLISNSDNTKQLSETLQMFQITNQFFMVDKTYGKYTLDGKSYKAYKIYDSGYYLEYIDESQYVFEAMIGLMQANNLSTVDTTIKLENKNYNKLTIKDKDELEFTRINTYKEIVELPNLLDKLNEFKTNNKKMHLLSIEIYGVTTTLHRIDASFLTYCTWLNSKVNNSESLYNTIKDLRVSNTFISKDSKKSEDYDKDKNIGTDNVDTNIKSSKITGTDLVVYTDLNESDMITYMIESAKLFNFDISRIKFKFRETVDTDTRDDKTLNNMKLHDELVSRNIN